MLTTYEELKLMNSGKHYDINLNLRLHYKLGANIDARASWGEGASGCAAYTGNGELPSGTPCTGWVPVGDNSTNQFTGSFDGGGHTINDLYVYVKRTSGNAYGGLFGYTGNGAEIKNLGLTDVYVNVSSSTSSYGGGLVGWNAGGAITNSYATGNVEVDSSSTSSYGGGLVGVNTYGTIMNSYATGNVEVSNSSSSSFTSSYGGGLVGVNTYGTIMNSYATGNVEVSNSSSFSSSYGGGLVGRSSGTISNSYATGNVEVEADSSSYGGGLVGYNYSTTISNSYATGNVEVDASRFDSYGGGLVGYMSFYETTISNSYAAGNVGCKTGGTCTNPKFGGLVGENAERAEILDGVTTTITGTITGTNYFVYNGTGTADDDGLHTGGCAMGATCAPATGATAALRLTWMRDTLNETTAFTTQAGTSPAYTAWDAASWADMNKVGGFPKLKYVEVDAFCTDSSYTTKATCETDVFEAWLAEGAECEVITPSSDNTAANNGDAKIPDCGDLITGQ